MEPPKRWRLAAPEWGNRAARRHDARGGQVDGVLIWNRQTGEGEVLLEPQFHRWGGIEASDAISDWHGLIGREYDAWSCPSGRVGAPAEDE